MRWLLLLLCWPVVASAGPRIAIIIDDLGYHRGRGEAVVDLPLPVTCAIIPSAPHAGRLAAKAAGQGKEILIHLPMAGSPDGPLDAGGLPVGVQRDAVIAALQEAVVRLPQARGLNNHMGSGLTAAEEPMDWLMQELAARKLFFVDSRTTPASVAERMARRHGLATGGRDIFLDNDRDLHRINEQFNRLLALARRRGQAIAIGHPYPETISYLRAVLPLLKEAGVEVVPVSALLSLPGKTAEAPAIAQQ